jgi:biopolymer transport protein ExbD
MSIHFHCSSCGKHLRAPDEFSGRKVRCSGCKTVVAVPETLQEHLLEEPAAAPDQDDDEDSVHFRKEAHEEELIDMTAMVDIVFFLLIFFLVTSVQTIQASIEMPAPDPDQGDQRGKVTVEALEQNDDYVIARIEKDDTVFINDSEAPTRQEVISKLKEAKEDHKGKGQFSLVVMANGDCHYETVVMVLDAGSSAGIASVRLASSAGDDEP